MTISKRLKLGVIMCLLIMAGTACSGFKEQLIYNYAQRAHNKKEFKTAIRLYKQLLDSDPHDKVHPPNAIIRYDLGVAYIDSGNRVKAAAQVKKLKKMKRSDLAKQLEKLLMVWDTL